MSVPFIDIDLPLGDRRDGKVRVSYAYGSGQRLFITTDRLSAFDRVIAGVPYKGQVLNQLSALVVRTNRRCRRQSSSSMFPTRMCSLPAPPSRCQSR